MSGAGQKVHHHEALVIGGGPAGAAAATVLAQAGRDVVLLEASSGPRYRIGESLLPHCYHTLERLGVREKVARAGFVEKRSVQFISADGTRSRPFYFDSHLDHPAATTWQVVRKDFDTLLLDHAQKSGVTIRMGTTATRLLESDGRVVGAEARTADGTSHRFETAVTIDASGRDALAIQQRGWRVPETRLDRLAAWGYFRNARQHGGPDEGATSICSLPGGGWVWFIPLSGEVVSVGVVARVHELLRGEKDLPSAFRARCAEQPWVAERLVDAEPEGPTRSTRNYSYHARRCVDDGLLLCGDAFAFLDPVFSSGVFLALTTGEKAGQVAAGALGRGRCGAEGLADYPAWLLGHIEPMRQLIFAFYDSGFSMGRLVRDHPEAAPAVTDILTGRTEGDFGPLYAAIDSAMERPGPLELEMGPGS